MASIAARAERLALAVQAVEAAAAALAGALGVDAPALPQSRDPMLAQAAQLEVLAGFVRQAADALDARPASAAVEGDGAPAIVEPEGVIVAAVEVSAAPESQTPRKGKGKG